MQVAERKAGTVMIDGVEVSYFDAGTDVENRPPLVLVHGTTGSTDSHFGYIFPMLSFRQRVISIDLKAPINTEDGLTYQQLVRQVTGVIEQVLPGQPVTLVGYSLGAVICAATAALHPGLIKNLILVAGWMKTDVQQQLRNQIWRELRDAKAESIKKFMVFCAFSAPFMASKSLEEVIAISSGIEINAFVDLQMALNNHIDISELVAKIQATTLLVACTSDQMVPKSHSKQLFGAIEDARYVEIASGHAVVYERPAELFQLIDNFSKNPLKHPAGSMIAAVKP